MIRIVLAGLADDNWQLYRQSGWMAAVRDNPELATRPRLHFDIDEDAYRATQKDWDSSAAHTSQETAVARLESVQAAQVRRT